MDRNNEALPEPVEEQLAALTRINRQLIQEVQKHRLTESLLRDSEERHRHLVELSPDAILIHRDFHIHYLNSAGCRMLGASQDEVLGRSFLDFIHPDDLHIILERAESLKAGQPSVPFRELRLHTLDGRGVAVEAASVAMQDKDGDSVQVVMRDVTEKKLLEARFLRTQRLESIGTLAGGIAHDLNNMLTPILMAVRLLRKERSAEERAGLLDTAEASIQRGSDMVKQLLAFTGGAEVRRVPVNLSRIVEEVTSLLRHTLPKSIRLETDLPADLPQVFGDATQLAQVLMNLCINARDAMPDGGLLRIEARTENMTRLTLSPPGQNRPSNGGNQSGYVAIQVKDTGTGIASEHMERIFDPFFTTKEKGKGTGLGLSTSLGIMRAHQGTIQADSIPGQGSTFTIHLPAHGSPHAAENHLPFPIIRRGAGQTVLIVDDEEPIRNTLSLALTGAGYHPLAVNSGADALRLCLASNGDIQAMILDMMMPGVDGIAVLKQLRAHKSKLPVIACSGVAVAARAAEVLDLGAHAFLQKPYSDDRLLATLAEVLADRPE